MKYERLTERREDGRAIYACSLCWEAEDEQTILDRLAELEDKIESGELKFSCNELKGEATHKLLERAEELAEEKLCSVKCLCPDLKEAGLCSGCEVFLALRDYYIQKIKEGEIE